MDVGLSIFGDDDLKDLEKDAADSSWSSYWNLARDAYEDAVKSIIQPERQQYKLRDLGPEHFQFPAWPHADQEEGGNIQIVREDLILENPDGEELHCSWWHPDRTLAEDKLEDAELNARVKKLEEALVVKEQEMESLGKQSESGSFPSDEQKHQDAELNTRVKELEEALAAKEQKMESLRKQSESGSLPNDEQKHQDAELNARVKEMEEALAAKEQEMEPLRNQSESGSLPSDEQKHQDGELNARVKELEEALVAKEQEMESFRKQSESGSLPDDEQKHQDAELNARVKELENTLVAKEQEMESLRKQSESGSLPNDEQKQKDAELNAQVEELEEALVAKEQEMESLRKQSESGSLPHDEQKYEDAELNARVEELEEALAAREQDMESLRKQAESGSLPSDEQKHQTSETPSGKRPMTLQLEPAVIYLHCNLRSRLAALEVLTAVLQAGMSLFAMDFAGCGHSTGQYIGLGVWEHRDITTSIEYLSSMNVSHIGLWGHSMGAVAALYSVSSIIPSQSAPFSNGKSPEACTAEKRTPIQSNEEKKDEAQKETMSWSKNIIFRRQSNTSSNVTLTEGGNKSQISSSKSMQEDFLDECDSDSNNEKISNPTVFGMVLDSPLTDFNNIVNDLIQSGEAEGIKIPSVLTHAASKAIKTMIWYQSRLDLDKISPKHVVAECSHPALFAVAVDDRYVLPKHTVSLVCSYQGYREQYLFEGDHYSKRPGHFLSAGAGFLQRMYFQSIGQSAGDGSSLNKINDNNLQKAPWDVSV